MPEMVPAIIDSVRVSLTSTQRLIILREAAGETCLPIWIGPYETESITIALQEIEVARPQTHDLIKGIIQGLNARLKQIEITALREDVFYSKLVLETESRIVEIDSRPSDAIAMAARYHVPILVDKTIFALAGILPEVDIRTAFAEKIENPPDSSTKPTAVQKVDPSQLEVFEKFLDQLKDQDNEPPQGEDSPDSDNKEKKP